MSVIQTPQFSPDDESICDILVPRRRYEEAWTLTSGLNQFDMGQEYKEWRWAELLELPFPIELPDVGAWVVYYPLGAPEPGGNISTTGAFDVDAVAAYSAPLCVHAQPHCHAVPVMGTVFE
jgi:hypothetical protein